jgi:predicted CXXCH cytochrome family protein
MLWDGVHPPVAKGECAACHGAPASEAPFAARPAGAAPCGGCHAEMLAATLARRRLHQPVAEGRCLACHAPHGSRERGLLRAGMLATCGACHADTIERQRPARGKHAPVRDGKCTLCHAPHASDVPLLLVKPQPRDLCSGCHSGQFHGHQRAAVRHPRNPNLNMDCTSCHRAHGTGNDLLLPTARTRQLCVRCHVHSGE